MLLLLEIVAIFYKNKRQGFDWSSSVGEKVCNEEKIKVFLKVS